MSETLANESFEEDVPLGTLGTYEEAFVALISEAVTSGRAVRADRLAVDGDLFAAGNRVEVDGEVTGTVHAAGRVVALDGLALGGASRADEMRSMVDIAVETIGDEAPEA